MVTGVVLVPANITSFAVPGLVPQTTASFAPVAPAATGLASLISPSQLHHLLSRAPSSQIAFRQRRHFDRQDRHCRNTI
jgi:hypothetical protein